MAARCIIRKERALPTYAASGTLCDKVLFMPSSITRYLDLLDEQREAIFQELGALPDAVLWYRPAPGFGPSASISTIRASTIARCAGS